MVSCSLALEYMKLVLELDRTLSPAGKAVPIALAWIAATDSSLDSEWVPVHAGLALWRS